MVMFWILAVLGSFMLGASTLLWWPAIVVVMAGAYRNESEKVYLLAFTAGLLTDFLVGKLLGYNALLFLVIVGIIYFVKTRFEFHWRWTLTFLVLSQILFRLV